MQPVYNGAATLGLHLLRRSIKYTDRFPWAPGRLGWQRKGSLHAKEIREGGLPTGPGTGCWWPAAAGTAGRLRRQQQCRPAAGRSEEHTSELQSLMRISYAVFCLKKKKQQR